MFTTSNNRCVDFFFCCLLTLQTFQLSCTCFIISFSLPSVLLRLSSSPFFHLRPSILLLVKQKENSTSQSTKEPPGKCIEAQLKSRKDTALVEIWKVEEGSPGNNTYCTHIQKLYMLTHKAESLKLMHVNDYVLTATQLICAAMMRGNWKVKDKRPNTHMHIQRDSSEWHWWFFGETP